MRRIPEYEAQLTCAIERLDPLLTELDAANNLIVDILTALRGLPAQPRTRSTLARLAPLVPRLAKMTWRTKQAATQIGAAVDALQRTLADLIQGGKPA